MMNMESNANGCVRRVSYDKARAPKMFSSDLVASSLPGRGLLYSLFVHWLFVAALFYVPWNYWLPSQARLVTAQSMIRAHEVLMLPALEPMGSGGSSTLTRSSTDNKTKIDSAASSSEAKARQGVVYNGPQLIVSDPPHPDNFVQTIRQPNLVAPPKLPSPLPLPALVSIASPKPELAPQPSPVTPPESKPIQVAASQPLDPRVEAPKLSLSPATSAEAVLHAVVADVPTPMPKLAHQDPPAKSEKREQNILVVDAFNIPAAKPPVIPPGELHGTFTISPAGTTAAGLAGGGVEAKGLPGIGNASGAVTGTSAAGAATTPNAGIGNKPDGKSAEGNAMRTAAAPGTGTAHGSTGSGNETGHGSGAGVHTLGNGSAPGTGFGSSPFPSIIIQGGSIQGGGTGNGRSVAATPAGGTAKPGAAKPQTSYEMTIVASGASGGGFKDYGVFRDEASYTVYLDMADTGARGSSWTLQYALDSSPGGQNVSASHAHGRLVPPYATLKPLPNFSPELAKRGHGGTIVVFGVINRQGKLEGLRIMHTPESGLNQFMLDALKKWTFRPAEIDGAQVSVKILLGVPVDSVPESNSALQIGSTRGGSHETAARF